MMAATGLQPGRHLLPAPLLGHGCAQCCDARTLAHAVHWCSGRCPALPTLQAYGDGTVRLTCEENVLFTNVPNDKVPTRGVCGRSVDMGTCSAAGHTA